MEEWKNIRWENILNIALVECSSPSHFKRLGRDKGGGTMTKRQGRIGVKEE